jgi:hypothetical protein
MQDSALLEREDVVPSNSVLILTAWATRPAELPEPWQIETPWNLTTFDGQELYVVEALALTGDNESRRVVEMLAALPIPPVTHAAIAQAVNDEWTDRVALVLSEAGSDIKETAEDAAEAVVDLAEDARKTVGNAWSLVDFIVEYAVPLLVGVAVFVGAFYILREVKK